MQPGTAQDKNSEKASWVVDEFIKHGHTECFTESAYQKIIAETVDAAGLGRGARILDIGCGTGSFANRLRGLGFDAYGIDLSDEMVTAGTKLWDGSRLLVGDAEALPFKDGSFDACFCSLVLHHFPDIDRLSREMARVVRPGGYIFGAEPNKLNWHVWLVMERPSPLRYDKNTENERSIDPAEVIGTLTRLGFDVEIKFTHLGLPSEGEKTFWDHPILYRYIGFVVKKIKGLHRILLGMIVLNAVHFMQRFQSPRRKSNNFIFCAKKR